MSTVTQREIELAELQRQNKAKQVKIALPEPSGPDAIDAALAQLHHTLKGVKLVSAEKASDRERELKIARLREGWNAPARHLGKTLDLSVKQWAATLGALAEKIGTGFLYALVGTRGPGKTQIGVELLEYAAQKLRSAQYCTAIDYFLTVKATYRKDSESTEDQAIREFCKPKLLVIDEVQERSESAWEDRLLTHLINKRYNSMTDTLLIANLQRAEFEQSLGKSVISRLNETGGIIEANWPSFRNLKPSAQSNL